MLVVIAIIAILAALLFCAVGRAKTSANLTACANNLRQIAVAVQLYASDSADVLPNVPVSSSDDGTNDSFFFYKDFVKSYVALTGPSSAGDKIFECPSDTFLYTPGDVPQYHAESSFLYYAPVYTSYIFNGANTADAPRPGVAGWKLGAILNPSRTDVVTEQSASWPWSWHDPVMLGSTNEGVAGARSMMAFADGHTSYTAIYYDLALDSRSFNYDPPVAYSYKWTGD